MFQNPRMTRRRGLGRATMQPWALQAGKLGGRAAGGPARKTFGISRTPRLGSRRRGLKRAACSHRPCRPASWRGEGGSCRWGGSEWFGSRFWFFFVYVCAQGFNIHHGPCGWPGGGGGAPPWRRGRGAVWRMLPSEFGWTGGAVREASIRPAPGTCVAPPSPQSDNGTARCRPAARLLLPARTPTGTCMHPRPS